jgi:selenide, water dikinase
MAETLSDDIPGIDLVCAGGCGGKLPADKLRLILSQAGLFDGEENSTNIIDQKSGDDAAVVHVNELGKLSIIGTIDVGYPITTSAYDWGRIAAANALSDVYAMGGIPIMALNLLGWPRENFTDGSAARVMMGGQATLKAAKLSVAGGHTMFSDSDMPFYGLSVTGVCETNKLMCLDNGVPGQDLIYTKPLGTGLASSQMLDGTASGQTTQYALQTMRELNDVASKIAVGHGVKTATDITGFGLTGHLRNMTVASGCGAVIHESMLNVIPGIVSAARNGLRTRAGLANMETTSEYVDWGVADPGMQTLLTDPQTSGGLLLASHNGRELLQLLHAAGVKYASIIGSFTDGSSISIVA